MDKVVYVKYSNERAERFNIVTEIYQRPDRSRYVVKKPFTPAADAHVQNIFVWYEKLQKVYANTPIRVNHCEKRSDGVHLEFLNGQTIEEELDRLLREEDYVQMIQLIERYFAVILNANGETIFRKTEKFEEVFGSVCLPENLRCGEIANIDMLFSNIIDDSGWQMIDYEWTFDFPVPVNFILYRALFFYLQKHEEPQLREMNLYQLFHISLEEQTAYAQMEQNFSRYMAESKVSVRQMCQRINNGRISVKEVTDGNRVWQRKALVFFDYGEGFEEKNSVFLDLESKAGGNGGKCRLIIPEGVTGIRIDPSERKCLLQVRTLFLENNGGHIQDYVVNGTRILQDMIVYFTDDPQIMIRDITHTPDVLHLEYNIYFEEEETLREWVQMHETLRSGTYKIKRLLRRIRKK